MRVVHVSAQRDARARAPAQLLEAWPTLADVAVAVARAGATVTVVQAAHAADVYHRDGVAYEFVDVGRARAARLAAAAARLKPDVVHMRGLGFPAELLALRKALPDTPLLVQDHASRPPRTWRRRLWRRALMQVDGFAFTAHSQVQPFVRSGLLPHTAAVFAVPGSSSHFRPGDMAAARAALDVDGDPCVVWVGRLNSGKDPHTALHGFMRAAESLPHARLWMCYGAAPRLEDVRALIAREPLLSERVRLLGTLPHARVELLMRAADLFLATSLHESTGFAMLEALACGTTPIVSAIPSFRELLADSTVGALFPPGDATALAGALVERSAADRVQARRTARAHFDERLSFRALGLRLVAIYETLIGAGRHRDANPTRAAAKTSPTAARSGARRRGHRTVPSVTRKLKVALVVPGGVDQPGTLRVIPCLLWLIERLARHVELHIIALRQEEHATRYPLLGGTVHCLPARVSRPRALQSMLQLNRALGFDVWHAVWMHPQGTLAGAAGILTRRSVLLHLNGGDLTRLPDIAYGGRVTARGRTWLRAAVAGASHITVPSEAMHRAAARLGISAEVVTYGVGTDRWPVLAPRSRSASEPARLLHVASLNHVKDQPTLLWTLALLRDSGVRFTADIVGEDTLGGAVHRLASTLGLEPVLRFHGGTSHDRVRRFFEQAHLLLVSSRHEADPIVALEAAVAGVPTVGTAVGHLADFAPDAAVAVRVGDAEGLARATVALLADDARRCDMARNAQRRARAMDADAAAARVLEIYEQLAPKVAR